MPTKRNKHGGQEMGFFTSKKTKLPGFDSIRPSQSEPGLNNKKPEETVKTSGLLKSRRLSNTSESFTIYRDGRVFSNNNMKFTNKENEPTLMREMRENLRKQTPVLLLIRTVNNGGKTNKKVKGNKGTKRKQSKTKI